MKKADRKEMIYLKYGVREELYGYPGMPERVGTGLLRAPQEKAGLFGKDNNAGKIQGCRTGGRAIMRWVDSIKEAIGLRLQELSGAAETGHGGPHWPDALRHCTHSLS